MSPRRRLLAEHLLLFYGLIGLVVLAGVPGGPIPLLVVAGIAVTVHLRRAPGFDRRDLVRPEALRPALPGILLRGAAFAVLAVAGVALFDPAHLFDMPREQPRLWAAILVLYPLASVYPQEVVYRAFLTHRYAPVFGDAVGWAGAVAFGFAHLIFGNVPAVVLTVAGGWLFARQYRRTRSLLAVSVEHSLYGATIFTVGLGRFFYHAATG